MSEHESDMKYQSESLEMLQKYGYDPKVTKLQTMDIKNKKLSNNDKNPESDTEKNGS